MNKNSRLRKSAFAVLWVLLLATAYIGAAVGSLSTINFVYNGI